MFAEKLEQFATTVGNAPEQGLIWSSSISAEPLLSLNARTLTRALDALLREDREGATRSSHFHFFFA